MDRIAFLFFLLAGCSASDNAAVSERSFAANQRDGLCITGGDVQRAGLILYGDGQANCSARGALVADGEAFALIPQGEATGTCRFRIERSGDGFLLAGSNGDCAYYCGPGATIRRTEFRPAETKTTDLAGDPLC